MIINQIAAGGGSGGFGIVYNNTIKITSTVGSKCDWTAIHTLPSMDYEEAYFTILQTASNNQTVQIIHVGEIVTRSGGGGTVTIHTKIENGVLYVKTEDSKNTNYQFFETNYPYYIITLLGAV